MIALAHGALGPADEIVLVLPVLALLVVAVGAVRSHNAKRRDDA